MNLALIDLIEEAVGKFPHRPALTDESGTLTYRQLWRRAERFPLDAARLVEERGVAILRGGRNQNQVTALLGAWRKGWCPLMLAPDTPDGRMEEIQNIIGDGDIQPDTEYLVTTSGSTGKPKVVSVGKGPLASVIVQQRTLFQMSEDSKALWILSPGFDACYSDIGTALTSGAELICGDPGGSLATSLNYHRITHIDIPPSLLALYQPSEFPPELEVIVVGGEPSPPEVLRRWARRYRVVAVYGPAEATVCCSCSVVDENWDQPYIGQPLEGVKSRVEEGELLIGGPHLANGYVGRDSSAFFEECGERWYRTGDRVSPGHQRHGYRFVGRTDRQIQLHGQRVELEEIEERARETVGRGAAAVVSAGGHLALFWETRGASDTEKHRLREQLRRVLPPSWIPHWLVPLKNMPRNSNGKLDRQRLEEMVPAAEEPPDSLACLQRVVELERLGSGVGVCDLLARNTVAMKTEELERTLPQLEQMKIAPGTPANRLLVTGGGGRLGSALLPLLSEKFEIWQIRRNGNGENIVEGDLSSQDQDWSTFRGKVDAVLHLAGDLDLSKPFYKTRGVNGDCLAHLSRLGVPVHFASTLAVPLLFNAQKTVLFGGYAQSKWIGEQILKQGQVPGFTWRPGQLLGEPHARDFLARIARGLHDLGAVPGPSDDSGLLFDLTPTSWAAEQLYTDLLHLPSIRTVKSIRKGWAIHWNDLLECLPHLPHLTPEQFLRLHAETPNSALARKALARLKEPSGRWPDFDLFLLGRDSSIKRYAPDEALDYLQRYLECLSVKGC